MSRKNTKTNGTVNNFNVDEIIGKMTTEENTEKGYQKFIYPISEIVNLSAFVGTGNKSYELFSISSGGISVNITFRKCKDEKIHCLVPSTKGANGNYYNNVTLTKELSDVLVEIYEKEFYEE